MKLTFAEKELPRPKILRNLPSGTVFGLYNQIDLNQNDRDYYMVITRNGHREYLDLRDGSFRPLNTDCPVMIMDCALTIYGIHD